MAGSLLDPEAQQSFVTGLPPVLPSLAKPKPQPSLPPAQPGAVSMGAPTPPPVTAIPPVSSLDPSPEQQRVSALRSQLQKDESKPSFTAGVWDKAKQYHQDHPGFVGRLGQVGAGILRGVDIGGEILAPNLARNIPGTGLNRWQNIQSDKADLATAEGQSTQAATAEKDRAEAYKALHPADKEEQWAVDNSLRGANGEPVMVEKNSGQTRIVPNASVYEKPDPNKMDPKVDEFVNDRGHRIEIFRNPKDGSFYQHDSGEARDTSGEGKGGGPLAVDNAGKVFRVKEGMTLPSGTQSFGGVASMNTKKVESGNAAVEAKNYAQTYVNSGKYTGPGDEALLERFFEVAKPTSGFRMTQQQMDMLINSRSWMDSAEGKTYHAAHGTWFSDEQRKQIADAMNNLQEARGEGQGFGAEQSPKPAGGKQPEQLQKEGWKWKNGSQGWGWYK